ncbi:MAG: hypothetical protein ACOX41_06840 [Anaerovoracaceae bacterium]|jgi:uncharacterized alkaline shock family protein YloU/adenylate kinase family enzyme
MKVYGLSGRSGTGKSYQAMNLCRERNIDSIVDDGLFIYHNEIMAGRSAKREETKVGAIKRALFYDDEHCREVTQAIERIAPASILILGTSDKMVEKIAQRLGLPDVDEMIHIEDITTAEERAAAHRQRDQQGKHVVPVPSFQLKRQFSGYFMHPLRMFRGRGHRDKFAEKSVVRPTYSYLGNFFISDKVITDIVEETARHINGIEQVLSTITSNQAGELSVLILVNFDMQKNAVRTGRLLQKKCYAMIEEMTAFNIKNVDIEIDGLC